MLKRVIIVNEVSTQAARVASSFELALALTQLAQEFPSVRVEQASNHTHSVLDDLTAARVVVSQWRGLTWDPERFDRDLLVRVPASGDTLWVIGPFVPNTLRVVYEVLSRYQLLVQRRNMHSNKALFAAIVERHRALFDLSKPLVRADYFHALDTWQWTLRLRSTASLEVQVAALFHDLERLVAPGEGGNFAARFLSQTGVSPTDCARIAQLVDEHESPGTDAELALLSDASALSFFSLDSARFIDYHGEAHTETKTTLLLRRLRKESVPRLRTLKLRADIERVVVNALRRLGADTPAHGPGNNDLLNKYRLSS